MCSAWYLSSDRGRLSGQRGGGRERGELCQHTATWVAPCWQRLHTRRLTPSLFLCVDTYVVLEAGVLHGTLTASAIFPRRAGGSFVAGDDEGFAVGVVLAVAVG